MTENTTRERTNHLSAVSIAKTFGARRVLHGVSVDFPTGEVHALVGGNGSGKSTLIKVLAGVERGDQGGLISSPLGVFPVEDYGPAQARALGIRVVHQQLALFDDLTVAENLSIGNGYAGSRSRIDWRRNTRRATEILGNYDLDVSPSATLQTLRPVERTMVAIARVLQDEERLDHAVLILDEPTASLPDHEAHDLYQRLAACARRGHSVLVVTHRLDEVLAHADKVTVLRDGNHVATREASQIDESTLVKLMLGEAGVAALAQEKGRKTDRRVLEVSDLNTGPLRDLDLTVDAGEIVGVAGLRGSGRSRLLRSIFGDLERVSGSISVAGKSMPAKYSPAVAMRAGVAMVPEERRSDALLPDLSVRENLTAASLRRYWDGVRLRSRQERSEALEMIDRFLIKTDGPDQVIEQLSGGNQQKVILARWLQRNPKVLLLDEPTQGVDVGARAEIYRLVRKASAGGAGALVVASDFEELVLVCDRVVVLKHGRIRAQVAGADLTVHRLTELVYETEQG